MQFQFERLCYARLGRLEKNAGYQIAARSRAVDGEMEKYFGNTASNVESIDGSAAEGVFFSEDSAYIARFVRSHDEMGRAATVSSALTLDGAAWRALLRECPRWRFELDRAFFDRPPEDAYPGHPAKIDAFDLPDAAKGSPVQLDILCSSIAGNDFKKLLRAVYSCLFAMTDEPLFISLPPERDSVISARNLMTALYTVMPAALSSLLSYCCGARLSTRLVFGASGERDRYANYVDLYPSPGNESLPRASYVQVPGTEFLDDLIDASIIDASINDEKRPGLLNEIDLFFDELRLFEGSAIAPVGGLRGRLQYALNAAWLHWLRTHDPEKLETRSVEYFCPGSDTAARTMLTLAAQLTPGRAYPKVAPVFAALLDLYADQPLHEIPSLQGVKLKKAAVDRELNHARAVFTGQSAAFENAYLRYLTDFPNTEAGEKFFRENVDGLLKNGTTEDVHLLARLLGSGDTAEHLTGEEWLKLRACYRRLQEKKDTKCARELQSALFTAFDELDGNQRETVVRGLLNHGINWDISLTEELLAHQEKTLCFLKGETVTEELKALFRQTQKNPESLKLLFMKEDGVLSLQPDEVRRDVYAELLKSRDCKTDLAVDLFRQKSLAALPPAMRAELVKSFFSSAAYTADGMEKLFQQESVSTLPPDKRAELVKSFFSSPVYTVAGMEKLFQQESVGTLPPDRRAELVKFFFSSPAYTVEAMEKLFQQENIGTLPPAMCAELVKSFFLSPAFTVDGMEKLLQQKSVSSLPPELREDLIGFFFTSPAYTTDAAVALFQQGFFYTLSEKAVSSLLCDWAEKEETWKGLNCVLAQSPVAKLGEDAYTRLASAILRNHKLSAVYDGGVESLLSGERVLALSEEGRVSLWRDAMAYLPGKRAELVELKGFTSLSPASKLVLLEEYPDELVVRSVLADPEVKGALLTGKETLRSAAVARCNAIYVKAVKATDKAFKVFYTEYLRKQFQPDLPQSKSALAELAQSYPQVSNCFFEDLLKEYTLSQEWLELADWYTVNYNLPTLGKDIDLMVRTLQSLKVFRLKQSAETYQKWIEDELRHRFDKEKRKETFLSSMEAQAAGVLRLEPLRNLFWETLRLDEIDFTHEEFYAQELPDSEIGQTVQETVSQASAAYCRLRKGGEPGPEGSRELYSLAISGRLYSLPRRGRLSKARRVKLLKELRSLTRRMLDEAPQALASSPDLVMLALFGDKEKLRRGDVDKLLRWVRKAEKAGVEIGRDDLGEALALQPKKTHKYYEKRFGKPVDMRVVRASVAVAALAACVTAGCIMLPPELEAYRIWEQHYPGETAVVSQTTDLSDRWKSTPAKLAAWFDYRQNDKKSPLSSELLDKLKDGESSGSYDFSNLGLDDAALRQLLYRIDTREPEENGGEAAIQQEASVKPATEIKLQGNSIKDLTLLSTLPDLTKLYLSGNAISDLAPLAHLTELTTLDLSGNKVSDLAPLTNLTNLTDLDLSGNAVSDLTPLANLTKLTVLYLSGNEAVTALSPLAALDALVELDVSGCSSLCELDSLSGLPTLQKLTVGGVGVSPRDLYKFVTKYAETNDSFTASADGRKISPLYSTNGQVYLPGDPILNLSGEEVIVAKNGDESVRTAPENPSEEEEEKSALSFLWENSAAHAGLRVLDLSCTDLDKEQLEELGNLRELVGSLRVLVLYGNPGLDSEAVSGLRQALTDAEDPTRSILVLGDGADEKTGGEVYLKPDGQNPLNLTELAQRYPNLRALDLSGQKAVNLTELAKAFPHLQALDLSGCGLTELKGLSGLKELEWLNLSHNQLTSLQSLYDSPLEKQLKWLDISFNPCRDSVNNLRNYEHLQVLYASDLGEGSEPISFTNDAGGTKLNGLTVLSASDQFDREKINKHLTALAVLELRPAYEEGRFLEPLEGDALEKLKEQFPNLTANGCAVCAGSYDEP